jgi:hypothetical protein
LWQLVNYYLASKLLEIADNVSVFSLTVAVGVQDRPAEAPQEGPYVSTWKLFGEPTFAEAMAAIASIIFAYVNNPISCSKFRLCTGLSAARLALWSLKLDHELV